MHFVASFDKQSNYRKPKSGMWDYLVKQFLKVKVDKLQSVYCGDAAGRVNKQNPKLSDFSSDDQLFSKVIGVPFCTPEMFFKGEKLNYVPFFGTQVWGMTKDEQAAVTETKTSAKDQKVLD